MGLGAKRTRTSSAEEEQDEEEENERDKRRLDGGRGEASEMEEAKKRREDFMAQR